MMIEFAIGFTQGVVVAVLCVVIATAFYGFIMVTLPDRKQGKKQQTGNRRTEKWLEK